MDNLPLSPVIGISFVSMDSAVGDKFAERRGTEWLLETRLSFEGPTALVWCSDIATGVTGGDRDRDRDFFDFFEFALLRRRVEDECGTTRSLSIEVFVQRRGRVPEPDLHDLETRPSEREGEVEVDLTDFERDFLSDSDATSATATDFIVDDDFFESRDLESLESLD